MTSLAVRVLARLRRHSLDEALARGDDPAGSSQLQWRARQLTSPSSYRKLATWLERAVDNAEAPAAAGAVAPLDRNAIRFAREALLSLAAQLSIADRVDPCGVARVRQLLTDGSSPMYSPGSPDRLHEMVRRARGRLHPA